ncbi:MAG: MobC family plasmid mobilization relaxosome protein [Clostridiaceae bacterium]|nr:MobC family plasmid mobilization relaxosome protein [Clostridiaceae bacterium]
MFCFRLSEKDYLSIQNKAERAKLNMTAYITTSALDKQIVVIDGLEQIIAELKAIGRNINQLTTLCNMGKIQCVELTETKEWFGAVFDGILNLCER